jgi:hypothetical protein
MIQVLVVGLNHLMSEDAAAARDLWKCKFGAFIQIVASISNK